MPERRSNKQQPASGAASGSKNNRPWRPPKAKKTPTGWSAGYWIGTCIAAAALAGVGVHLYREYFPTEQRCPPEDDRFHDHCQEGRKHYVLSLDWTCLGTRRAEAMRAALSLPHDGKPLLGVGDVPSWLTDANAEALATAPCIQAVEPDLRCSHCKPTPKMSDEEMARSFAQTAPSRRQRSGSEPVAEQQQQQQAAAAEEATAAAEGDADAAAADESSQQEAPAD